MSEEVNQALQIVKIALGQYKGTLQDHQQIQGAVEVIENELQPKKPKEDNMKKVK